jgi:hypothetical protein
MHLHYPVTVNLPTLRSKAPENPLHVNDKTGPYSIPELVWERSEIILHELRHQYWPKLFHH